MSRTILLKRAGTTAIINPQNGQLFSLIRSGKDVMWNGGSPESERPMKGWQNSELVMFPIIGKAQDDKIMLDGQDFSMTQHGISRHLHWEIACTGDSVFMQQEYNAGDEVHGKDGEILSFPRSFAMAKRYSINDAGSLVFSIEIENKSPHSALPYSIGWQPAFRTPNGSNCLRFQYGADKSEHDTGMPLEFIKSSQGNVMAFGNNKQVRYETDEFNVAMVHNFGNVQMWYNNEGFVGIGPISSPTLDYLSHEEIPHLDLIAGLKWLKRGHKDSYEAIITIAD